MTTVADPNVLAVAVDGTFDDCQDLVKAMFNDAPFRERMRLAAVNSINWARVMAQTVYYVTTARALAGPVTVCVPTGNFGNLFAGWVARRMGTPIADFVVASNANDILTRFVESGEMSMADVVPTLSPSMDIQVSSNFERMLWVMNDGNGAAHRRADAAVPRDRAADARARDSATAGSGARSGRPRSTDEETLDEIRRVHATTGMLIDPHTATGTRAARLQAGEHPVVTMATAHPAKFPDAVERATGRAPGAARAPRRPARTSGAHRGRRQRSRRRRGPRRPCRDALTLTHPRVSRHPRVCWTPSAHETLRCAENLGCLRLPVCVGIVVDAWTAGSTPFHVPPERAARVRVIHRGAISAGSCRQFRHRSASRPETPRTHRERGTRGR